MENSSSAEGRSWCAKGQKANAHLSHTGGAQKVTDNRQLSHEGEHDREKVAAKFGKKPDAPGFPLVFDGCLRVSLGARAQPRVGKEVGNGARTQRGSRIQTSR